MTDLTRYKIEFSFAPLAVIAIAAVATWAALGSELAWKAAVVTLAIAAAKPAAEALWSVWWAGADKDGDDDDTPQHGAPTGAGEPYAPVLN